jgi:hypothetical protein
MEDAATHPERRIRHWDRIRAHVGDSSSSELPHQHPYSTITAPIPRPDATHYEDPVKLPSRESLCSPLTECRSETSAAGQSCRARRMGTVSVR